jgi:hypothetical protein
MDVPKTHARRPGAIGFTQYTYCGRRWIDVEIKNSKPTCHTCKKARCK